MGKKANIGGGRLEVKVHADGRVNIKAHLYGYVFSEEESWVSVCPPLDISTSGSTKKQALDRSIEAIQLFFEACVQHGTLDEALKQLNWIREENIDISGLTRMHDNITGQAPPTFQVDKLHLDRSGHKWTSAANIAC